MGAEFLARRPMAHGVLFTIAGLAALAVDVAVQDADPGLLLRSLAACAGGFGTLMAVAGASSAGRAAWRRHKGADDGSVAR